MGVHRKKKRMEEANKKNSSSGKRKSELEHRSVKFNAPKEDMEKEDEENYEDPFEDEFEEEEGIPQNAEDDEEEGMELDEKDYVEVAQPVWIEEKNEEVEVSCVLSVCLFVLEGGRKGFEGVVSVTFCCWCPNESLNLLRKRFGCLDKSLSLVKFWNVT